MTRRGRGEERTHAAGPGRGPKELSGRPAPPWDLPVGPSSRSALPCLFGASTTVSASPARPWVVRGQGRNATGRRGGPKGSLRRLGGVGGGAPGRGAWGWFEVCKGASGAKGDPSESERKPEGERKEREEPREERKEWAIRVCPRLPARRLHSPSDLYPPPDPHRSVSLQTPVTSTPEIPRNPHIPYLLLPHPQSGRVTGVVGTKTGVTAVEGSSGGGPGRSARHLDRAADPRGTRRGARTGTTATRTK